jgi:hypothetical protein
VDNRSELVSSRDRFEARAVSSYTEGLLVATLTLADGGLILRACAVTDGPRR